MGITKELKTRIDDAIPTMCPHCQCYIDEYVDWEAIYGVINELLDGAGKDPQTISDLLDSALLSEHG